MKYLVKLLPALTWKADDELNELMALSEGMGSQNVNSTSWLPLAVFDKILQER